jgi:hypothetical protein
MYIYVVVVGTRVSNTISVATHGVNCDQGNDDGTPPHEYELVAKRYIQPTLEMTHTQELNTFKTAEPLSTDHIFTSIPKAAQYPPLE